MGGGGGAERDATTLLNLLNNTLVKQSEEREGSRERLERLKLKARIIPIYSRARQEAPPTEDGFEQAGERSH